MIRLPKFIQRIIDFLVGKKQRPLKKYNFLIVCTGNTCRSPMAQRIVECLKVVPGYVEIIGEIKSAGTNVTDKRATANADKIVRDMCIPGMSLENHVPTQLTQELVDEADIILTTDLEKSMAIRRKFDTAGKVKTIATFGNDSGPISDPYGGSLEQYLKTYLQMERLLSKGVNSLYEQTIAKSEGRV